MSNQTKDITGSCYCNGVKYRAVNVKTNVSDCHCSQCRKQSGHRYAVVMSDSENIDIDGENNITWFRSSDEAQRGFCSNCGSHLFWKSLIDTEMAILAASIDNIEGFHLSSHIFVQDKGGYYEIEDDLPKFKDFDTPL